MQNHNLPKLILLFNVNCSEKMSDKEFKEWFRKTLKEGIKRDKEILEALS